MVYIQRSSDGITETVDQFETFKEARKELKEFKMSDSSANYYTSSRACKEWRESKESANAS